MSNLLIFISLFFAVLSLFYAFYLYRNVINNDEGNDKVKEICGYIREGSNAFLSSEYKIIGIFAVVAFLSLFFAVNLGTALAFLLGALLSSLAGFIGMKSATHANGRTATAAQNSGMNKALDVAFKGGAVMGMCVVGLGLLGLLIIYILGVNVFGLSAEDTIKIAAGFSLGASSIALFGRVGGGIFTKAADVGADLVGKVEVGIPEDDPRNPAVIADNVGDNVGDVAGMGSDLLESYVSSIIASLTLGVLIAGAEGAIFALILAGCGIFASIIGSLFVKGKEGINPHKSLKIGTYVSSIITIFSAFILNFLFLKLDFFNDTIILRDNSVKMEGLFAFGPFSSIIIGLFVGALIGWISEIYTSSEHKFVKFIAKQSETGHATNIISGISIGMQSTCIPVILLAGGIVLSYYFGGLYGISLAAVGMLSTAGMTVSVDAYGPISDNAGGIAEMGEMDHSVREITDKLDSVGNTTAAIAKGFAIGSAALTSLALFASFTKATNLPGIDISKANVIAGLMIGGMLPFLFSSFTIESVGKAANKMIEEVRRQFREIPGILNGTNKPEYAKCVKISTKAALREMILPALIAIAAPIITGILLGNEALGGMLAGSLISGIMLAIFMANAGGAWDNSKKYIEEGNLGGKGSETHKAAVTGDTVGDPFKDTSGPSLDILIKLMTTISLVIFGGGAL